MNLQLEKTQGFSYCLKIFLKDFTLIFLICAAINVANELLYTSIKNISDFPFWRTIASISLYAVFWATLCYLPFLIAVRKFKSPRLLFVSSLALFVLKLSLEPTHSLPPHIEGGYLLLEKLLTPFFFLTCYALVLVIKERRKSERHI